MRNTKSTEEDFFEGKRGDIKEIMDTANSKTFSNFNFKNSQVHNGKDNYRRNFYTPSREDYEIGNNFNRNTMVKSMSPDWIEKRKKIIEYKLKEEEYLQNEKIKMEEKKLRMEEKENERLYSMERRRIEFVKDNEKIRVNHKERYHKEKIKLKERIDKENDYLLDKQDRQEKKKESLEALRNFVFRQRNEELNKKYDEIQKFFDIEKIKDDKRNAKIERKIDNLAEHKKKLELVRENEIRVRVNDMKEKNFMSSIRRDQKEQHEQIIRENVVHKLHAVGTKVKEVKENNERDLMFKSERNSLKRSETLLNGKRIENVKEYEILMERKDIEEKYKKSSDFNY